MIRRRYLQCTYEIRILDTEVSFKLITKQTGNPRGMKQKPVGKWTMDMNGQFT